MAWPICFVLALFCVWVGWVVLLVYSLTVTSSDKRVTKSVNLVTLSYWYQHKVQPRSFNLTQSFITVQKWSYGLLNQGVSSVAILRKWSWKDLHCFSQSRLLPFEMCFKVMYSSKSAVSSTNIVALQCEKVETDNLIKWPLGDVFSSYLVIFPATLSPFCQSGSQYMLLFFGSLKTQTGIRVIEVETGHI